MAYITKDLQLKAKLRSDFKNCLYYVFKHINLPPPTEIQYAIGDCLQYAGEYEILMGFRGIAKSTITSVYEGWCLDLDPENEQILRVGANSNEAKKWLRFTRSLLEIVPVWNYLVPRDKQIDNSEEFVVAPAVQRGQPSYKSVGIFGKLTGNRAKKIIADDIETLDNCRTNTTREALKEAVSEFKQITKALNGTHLLLGTPHTEYSIYNELYKKGYKINIFPIKYPTEKEIEKYGDKLATYILNKVTEKPELAGKPTDPKRFDEIAILDLESEGRSKFAMQQMLDTTLSDIEKYPLKCSDLIVTDVDIDNAPEKILWGSHPDQIIKDLDCVGMATDKFYKPMQIKEVEWLPYQMKAMTIDPSGRGQDETSYACGGVLNSQIFVMDVGGYQGGYDDETLVALAKKAYEYRVNKIIIEDNFGKTTAELKAA